MTTLMFWNKQNSSVKNNGESKSSKKNWLHPQDTLINGHVVYPVKFLGSIIVDQPKGIDTVKDAIRRLQFAQQVKKVDAGFEEKSKKVEITISIHGVAVQEPKENKILHQFPLHTISYCTDEKGVKKYFSFIVKITPKTHTDKDVSGVDAGVDCHKCFVFISSKLASDITLTIGQAFEIAYSRYVSDSGTNAKITELHNKNSQLEDTITIYRKRLKDLVDILPKSDVDKLLLRYGIKNIYEIPDKNSSELIPTDFDINKNGYSISNKDDQLLISDLETDSFTTASPQKTLQNHISNTLDAIKSNTHTKMDELLLNSDSDSDFDPRADEHEHEIAAINFKIQQSSPFGQPFVVNNINNNMNNSSSNNNNNNNHNINNGNGFSMMMNTNGGILKPTSFCT